MVASGKCVECGSPYVVNKKFKLCGKCNNIRLHGGSCKKDRKPIKIKACLPGGGFIKQSKRGVVTRTRVIDRDEQTYEKVFNSKPNYCEECQRLLPDTFRDDEGRVIQRSQFSHIVPKSIAPELRHNPEAINRLCINCHSEWEHGDKKGMRIYASNSKKFPNYF